MIEILKLVWPLALGMVNNAAMQFVDRAFLAHESMASLEAVLPASTLAWVFMSFFQSVVGYSGVFVAQFHGAHDALNARRSYRAGMVLALVSGLLMLPVVPFGHVVFGWAGATGDLLAREFRYFDIVTLGGVFVYVQMAALSYFTGLGRTRIVFWVNVAGNLLNVALDPLLIFGLDTPSLRLPALGIAGAAVATVVALAFQSLVLVVAARRVKAPADAALARSCRGLVCSILRYGVPAGGYEVLNLLSFTIFVFLTARVGDLAFAVSNACFTVNYLLFAPMTGFGIGAQTLVGQCLGRKDVEGARRVLRQTLLLGCGFVAVACALVLALNGPILALFAPAEPALRGEFAALGFTLLLLMTAWMVFDGADVILSGALKGAGDTRFVFGWMLFCAFVLWIPSVLVVLRLGGAMPALWSTMVVYVLVICAGSFLRWKRGAWRRHALV